MTRAAAVALAVLLSLPLLPVSTDARLAAQATVAADPADVGSPAAVVRALYETVTRRPGEPFDWERMRGLFLPEALMIPNPEQTGGAHRVLTVEDFIAWVDGGTVVGGPGDAGFQEEEIARRTERYGDVAHVFSTYRKHVWGDTTALGRGVNAIQLLQRDGRWWVTSIAWDEESGAGPLPERYLRGRDEGTAGSPAPVALVTGSTSGLGREVARRLAARGAHVIVHGRDRERGAALVAEIEERTPGSARFYAADFGSLDEVRTLARSIRRDYQRLDVLVNNAGIWLEPEDGRRLSADGHELHFQVNYLAGFLLTRELLPLLRSSAPARVVNVSSVAQRPLDFDDVMLEQGYSDGRAYAQSKLAQIMFTFDLARELEGTGVTVSALHPATMMDTNMVLSRGAAPRASVEEGTDAVMRLVTGAETGHGRYFRGTEPTRANEQAYDESARARLRSLSEALAGTR